MSEVALSPREILLEVREDVKELGVSLGELRLEVATSTATKADLAKVADKADDGIRRIWSEGVNPLEKRVEKLEQADSREEGASTVRARVVAVLIGLATGAALTALAWILRGCG